MQQPLVTIIITTYNRCKLLPRALKSAINQTYSNIEIIVVDDASNDYTTQIVQEYLLNDTRIKYIKNENRSGANVSRNKAVSAAKGVFIAGLDDDDEFLPDRIRLLIKNYDPSYAFITSLNIIQFDTYQNYSRTPEVVTLEHMKEDNVLMNQALIEKQRLVEVGLYDEALTAYQDYDIWIRLIQKFGNVKVLQKYTQKVYFESHRERISTLSQKRFKGYFNFYKKHKSLFSMEQRKFFLATFYTIRNKKISISTYLSLKTMHNEAKLSKLLDNPNFHYYIVQNFYENLQKIDKSKHYVLYGYGSIGKLLFPLLKPNILAIVDSSFGETKKIDNIPVITYDNILDYSENLLLTPTPYRDEILQILDSRIYVIDIFNI